MADFEHERTCPTSHRPLRRSVACSAGEAVLPSQRSDVDNCAALCCNHVGEHCASEHHRRTNVEPPHRVELFRGQFNGGFEDADACIVDEYINAASPVERRRNDASSRVIIGDVRRDSKDAAFAGIVRLLQLGKAISRSSNREYTVSLLDECVCNCASYSTTCAGDDREFGCYHCSSLANCGE